MPIGTGTSTPPPPPGTGTGTSPEPRRLSLRVRDRSTGAGVYAGTGTGKRPVYITTLCSTLSGGRRISKRVPGTGSGGWMYAGTGSRRRSVFEYAECITQQFVSGTGTGSVDQLTLCCPTYAVPRFLYMDVQRIEGPCEIYEHSFFVPPADSPNLRIPLVFQATGPFAGTWVSLYHPLGLGYRYVFACQLILGNPRWLALAYVTSVDGSDPCWPTYYSAGEGGAYGIISEPPDCTSPFCIAGVVTVQTSTSVPGGCLESGICPPGTTTYYEIKVYVPGVSSLCGGSTVRFTGTGTGTGTAIVNTPARRTNRGLGKFVTIFGRRVYVETCCPSEAGTGTGDRIQTDCETDPISRNLVATLTSSCAGANGKSFSISYIGFSDWRGTVTINGQTVTLDFECSGGLWGVFMTTAGGATSCEWDFPPTPGGSGFPVVATASGTTPGMTCCPPGSSLVVTVTEP